MEEQEKIGEQEETTYVDDEPANANSGLPKVSAILSRIQNHVGPQRIRVAEFFKDFDRLRSYSIPRQEFVRGLDMIDCRLQPAELEALADHYRDQNKKGCCRWKDFELEIEKG